MRDIFARFASFLDPECLNAIDQCLELWHELLAQFVDNREAASGQYFEHVYQLNKVRDFRSRRAGDVEEIQILESRASRTCLR